MAAPLSEFLAVLDETLERYGVPAASVSAVATVGGGARIPLITQRLSEHLRAPVVTTPHPQLTAAEGAALIAYRSRVVDTATALTPTAPAAAPTTATIATDGPLVGTGVVRRRRQRGRTALQRRDRLPARGALPPRGMAGRTAASAWPTGAVRSVGGRRGHRRGRVRHHPAQRHHHHSGRSGDHLDHLPRACGAGQFPSYPGAAGPPSDHRRRAAARTAVLSRAAATEYAGAGDAQRAADDDASYDVRAAADDGSDTAADATDLTADIS